MDGISKIHKMLFQWKTETNKHLSFYDLSLFSFKLFSSKSFVYWSLAFPTCIMEYSNCIKKQQQSLQLKAGLTVAAAAFTQTSYFVTWTFPRGKKKRCMKFVFSRNSSGVWSLPDKNSPQLSHNPFLCLSLSLLFGPAVCVCALLGVRRWCHD